MESVLDKIQQVSAEECQGLRRLPFGMLIGHCAYVFDKVGIPHVNPIPEEYFDAVIWGLCDAFYNGCEPEFETEEEWDNYENAISKLKSCKYIVEDCDVDMYGRVVNYRTLRSPYMDKSIPFLSPKKEK